MKKKELLGLFPQELAEELRPLGLPAFRSAQIFQWLHRGAGFADMTNLPKALRTQLEESFVDQPVSILEKRVSKLDGTVKMLYALRDGNCVEGVLMRYHYGYTLCLSTQVGCRMGCAFCASTLGGCVRSLSAAEMLGQILDNESVSCKTVLSMLTSNQRQLLSAISMSGKALNVLSNDFVSRHHLGATSSVQSALRSLLKKQLAKLTKWGVEWLHDSLEMKVQLLEHFNPKENEIRYRFFISCAETRFLAKANNFSTIDELMACVRQYFEALEVNAGISVTSKKLETNERLLAMVSQKDREMFIIK